MFRAPLRKDCLVVLWYPSQLRNGRQVEVVTRGRVKKV